jgi:hypothetical protein
MGFYKKAGIYKVTLHADIDVGSYAWARFGFVPNKTGRSDQTWDGFRTQMANKLNHKVRNPADRAKIKECLDDPNPYAIWKLSDLRNSNGESIAKEFLMNEDWYGHITLSDEAAMRRFNFYVTRARG